jgi:pyridoxamine 5'-phosphate oxidase
VLEDFSRRSAGSQGRIMDFDHPPADPVALLQRWIQDASEIGLPNPNAAALSTVDANGQPSSRMVLVKDLDERGAVFFTNRQSRKAAALAANPRAALLLFWDALGRQARIEGDVSPTSDEESDAYFATRPRASQISAWASRQSQPATDRAALDAAAADIERRFENQPVPRPPHWGGYRVSLNLIEFWQGHLFRLHDRVIYTPDSSSITRWRTQRLFP